MADRMKATGRGMIPPTEVGLIAKRRTICATGGEKSNFPEACHNHNDHHRHHHDRNWWHHHCNAVVLVDWGFWGWSDGWWYPAWGYDPYYSYYEYDGPIYCYDGLLPDEIVASVQSALQDLGTIFTRRMESSAR